MNTKQPKRLTLRVIRATYKKIGATPIYGSFYEQRDKLYCCPIGAVAKSLCGEVGEDSIFTPLLIDDGYDRLYLIDFWNGFDAVAKSEGLGWQDGQQARRILKPLSNKELDSRKS